MARPPKRYRIYVRGRQREDIDADLLMQALLLMAEERLQAADASETRGPGVGSVQQPGEQPA